MFKSIFALLFPPRVATPKPVALHVYQFTLTEPVHFCPQVEVTCNNETLGIMPLYPAIWYGFTTRKLTEWLGQDNASNIINYGEEVILIRKKPLNTGSIPFIKKE